MQRLFDFVCVPRPWQLCGCCERSLSSIYGYYRTSSSIRSSRSSRSRNLSPNQIGYIGSNLCVVSTASPIKTQREQGRWQQPVDSALSARHAQHVDPNNRDVSIRASEENPKINISAHPSRHTCSFLLVGVFGVQPSYSSSECQ